MYQMQIVNRCKPTYRPSSSLLDIIATNRSDLVRRAGVTRCHYGGPQDFARIALGYQSRQTSLPPDYVNIRPMNRVDTAAFNHELSVLDWSAVYLLICSGRRQMDRFPSYTLTSSRHCCTDSTLSFRAISQGQALSRLLTRATFCRVVVPLLLPVTVPNTYTSTSFGGPPCGMTV